MKNKNAFPTYWIDLAIRHAKNGLDKYAKTKRVSTLCFAIENIKKDLLSGGIPFACVSGNIERLFERNTAYRERFVDHTLPKEKGGWGFANHKDILKSIVGDLRYVLSGLMRAQETRALLYWVSVNGWSGARLLFIGKDYFYFDVTGGCSNRSCDTCSKRFYEVNTALEKSSFQFKRYTSIPDTNTVFYKIDFTSQDITSIDEVKNALGKIGITIWLK